MILSIGEILVDMIGDKENAYRMFIGGAPFNVAVNARQAGAGTGFVGRIGKDVAGRFIKQQISAFNLDYVSLQEDKERNTTLAFVALDETGERYFTFFRHDTADFNLSLDEINFNEFKDLRIVHLGSLMLSEQKGVEFAEEMVKRIKKSEYLFSFDVNFRYDLYKTKEDAFRAYKPFIERADILKFSQDEILDYTRETSLVRAIEKLNCKGLLLITLGSEGSMFAFGGKSRIVETIKVKPVDTTGAGDAFYGAALAHIDRIGFENLNTENLTEILKAANEKGAKATLHKGAVSTEG
ncbi:MAG TPA: carbohydrate kinase [Clostridia bacterium]|jgi:fructokinase|nr:carbohydrate kinase [Clostridia bacterium]